MASAVERLPVATVSLTRAGSLLADRLPYLHAPVEGSARATVAGLWGKSGGLVLVMATGAAVRLIAPLLGDKEADPAVVCVDDAGRWAVSLTGGHARASARDRQGANELALEVASLIGAEAVVTTASESAGIPALESLGGFAAEGDVAAVTTALLDRSPVELLNPARWPLPDALTEALARCSVVGDHAVGADHTPARRATLVVSDRLLAPQAPERPDRPPEAVLRPASLVLGVGTSSDCTGEELRALADRALDEARLCPASVAKLATIDLRVDHPAVTSLGVPVVCFSAGQLEQVQVPNPSDAVRSAVGTASVAEAAAVLAAGPGAELVVAKTRSERATVAVARMGAPRGILWVVGLGPGGPWHRTPAASRAVSRADMVIGYGPYVDQAGPFRRDQQVIRSPIGAEVARALTALDHAASGRRVAMVCSGDSGVYGMAAVCGELAAEYPGVEIEVVPGVTAAAAAAALVGAPLGHDHTVISLSDLHTPWDRIAKRIAAAAGSDTVTVFYNPRSEQRPWQLGAALEMLAKHRGVHTPVAVVTDAAREAEQVHVTTLAGIDPSSVGMRSLVIVGSTATLTIGGMMITPRGLPDHGRAMSGPPGGGSPQAVQRARSGSRPAAGG